MYTKDLSKFKNCTIKKPLLDDLMHVPEFEAAAANYQGIIDDVWVKNEIDKIVASMEWAEGKEDTPAKGEYIALYGLAALQELKAFRRYMRLKQKTITRYLRNSTNEQAK